MIEMIPIEEDAVSAFYSKYFTEADAPEEPPANHRKIVIGDASKGEETTVNGKAVDMSNVALDSGEDDAPPADDGAATDTGDDGPVMDTGDTTGGDAGGEDGPMLDTDDNTGADNGGDTADNTGADNGGDNGGTDDGPMLDPEGKTGDDGGNVSQDDGPPPDDGPGQDNGSNDNPIHKQMLFKRFIDLHDSIDGFIKRLEESLNRNLEMNKSYTAVADKLKQLNEFIYDYMVVKYKDASYAASMLFYQRSLATAHLTVSILGDEVEKFSNLKEKPKKKEKESKTNS